MRFHLKSLSRYEDAIEDAIIAMNEPKDASVPALRHYLSEYHTEYRVADRPKVLQRALERCEERGWIQRVTGKGFSGTFRLAFRRRDRTVFVRRRRVRVRKVHVARRGVGKA